MLEEISVEGYWRYQAFLKCSGVFHPVLGCVYARCSSNESSVLVSSDWWQPHVVKLEMAWDFDLLQGRECVDDSK